MTEGRNDTAAEPGGFVSSGRFTAVRRLGEGSMGVVYRVHDDELDADVALKTLTARGPDQLYRLKQEFRVLADIIHPNLVHLYDLVVTERDCFFTMELVDGVDFVRYTRRDAPVRTPLPAAELPRFAAAALELVRGVTALHAADTLHRDIKPSNVLVTSDGRVVLLDFGLAVPLRSPPEAGGDSGGTLAYMAPEQAWGKSPTPASDWYSVAAVLYEVLAGRLPAEGKPHEMFQAKRKGRPTSLRLAAPEVPADLDAVICALLDPEPARRPAAAALQAALGNCTGRAPETRTTPMEDDGARPRETEPRPFLGRKAELQLLREALASLTSGRAAVVHVRGPSGIGKTELVRHFTAAMRTEQPGAIVLHGRCHAQEEVPYNALDAVVDALSRFLVGSGRERVDVFVPEDADALVRMFPVLGRVEALAAAAPRDEGLDPVEVRRRGFRALRESLASVGTDRPVVVWIDDLQWSDADSAAALRELLRPPGAPRLLYLLSSRSEDAESAAAQAVHRAIAEGEATSFELDLKPLEAADARALVRALCAGRHLDEAQIDAIAAESEGWPFFVDELARHVDSHRAVPLEAAPMARRLSAMMAQRLQGLPVAAREILAVVAVAGRPLDPLLALRAAGVRERGRPTVVALEHDHLLRSSGARGREAVEVYHDRIRELILSDLAADTRRQHHRQLADVLETSANPDPLELFLHLLGAEEAQRARPYGIEAADRAARTLAFERAAQLYRQVLDLPADSDAAERAALLAKLGDALANDGRGPAAGDALEAAAEAALEIGAPTSEIVGLRRRAAEQYLRAGHLDRGTAVTREVMAAVGVPFPETPGQALFSALRARARLAWRGLRFTPRTEAEISPATLLRLESCWSASLALSVVDQILGEVFGVRHLIEALDNGEPSHILRAFGLEAAKSAAYGGGFFRRRSRRLLEMTQEMGRGSADPYNRAWCSIASGTTAYEDALWRRAFTDCEEGVRLLRAHCTGVNWEIVTFSTFALSGLAHMGELASLADRLPAEIRDADERGNDYAAIGLRSGVLNLVWLARGDPAEGRREVAEAMARWPDTGVFHVQHYLRLIADVNADLYQRDPWAAWRRLNEAWSRLSKALLLRMEGTSVELRNLRARTALAAAAGHGGGAADKQWPRALLLKTAAGDAKALAKRTIASAKPFATAIRAGIAQIEGRLPEALATYDIAARDFAAVEMGLYAAGARLRAAELRGGSAGEEQAQEARTWLKNQRVRDSDAMARVFAPAA